MTGLNALMFGVKDDDSYHCLYYPGSLWKSSSFACTSFFVCLFSDQMFMAKSFKFESGNSCPVFDVNIKSVYIQITGLINCISSSNDVALYRHKNKEINFLPTKKQVLV